MKAATTLIIAAIIACTNAQSTDLSPPFNPDPEFTSTIPVGSGSVSPPPSLTPDVTPIDPDTVTGEVTLTYFTETMPTSGAMEPPILTGRPSGRPSTVPENTDIVTPTTATISTVIGGNSTIVTTKTGVVRSTTSTVAGGGASTTTTGASPSVTNAPAAAPKLSGGLTAVIGGLMAGILGVVVMI